MIRFGSYGGTFIRQAATNSKDLEEESKGYYTRYFDTREIIKILENKASTKE